MRLSGRLFLEQLLDQDAYLEWFLGSLHASNLDMLPVWLSTIGVYWKNLTSYRKRGRRLAQILLDKLAWVCHSLLFRSLRIDDFLLTSTSRL